jgi:hypothetical protein
MIPIVGVGNFDDAEWSILLSVSPNPFEYERIQTELKKIEKSFDVKVIYACESGSRAWGFPSANSDYMGREQWLKSYLTVWLMNPFAFWSRSNKRFFGCGWRKVGRMCYGR